MAGLPFDGIGLDFVKGKQTAALVSAHDFLADKALLTGLVSGKKHLKVQLRRCFGLPPGFESRLQIGGFRVALIRYLKSSLFDGILSINITKITCLMCEPLSTISLQTVVRMGRCLALYQWLHSEIKGRRSL